MSSEQGIEPTIARLQAIDGYDFEDFVGDFFEEDGWTTEVTQASNDDGIDVIAERTGVIEERAVIQAKRHAPDNKVTFGDVQRYSALVRDEHRNDMAVVVTSSAFTRKAYNYAREKNVKLMDGAAIAGFIIANDRADLVRQYTPEDFEIDEAPEEVFLADEGSREQYFRDRPMEFAARVFEEQELLDALDTIDIKEVGSALVESLDEFRAVIEEQSGTTPTDLLRENPRFLDVRWFDVEVSEESSDRFNQNEDFSSLAGPPANIDVVCYKHEEKVTACAILPIGETITRQHLMYIEDCVDYLRMNYQEGIVRIEGVLLGSEIASGSVLRTKMERLRAAGIDTKTYVQVLSDTVRAKQELLDAVQPFFRSSQNEDMLEMLSRLDRFT